jgi:PAS domain S-box-containing protein
MTASDEREEELLRSVALQNASTIQLVRRRDEKALLEQTELLRTTLASIGDGVISTDAQGRVVFLNRVAQQLCAWTQADAAGRPLAEVFRIINEPTSAKAETPVDRVLREGSVVGPSNQTLLIARDGTERPIDDSAAPIRGLSGEIEGVVVVFRDVTDRRRADLDRSRLAAIVESSEDAIVSKTLDGIITSWNQGAERILGYRAEEIVGRHISILMPPDRAEDLERILSKIRRGERVEHYETSRRCKDGTVLDVSLTVSPIRNAAGEIIGASKIARDITARKRAEEALLEADRRKDEFLAMLAHELRNPLAAVSHAVQVAQRSEAEEDRTWARGVIEDQATRLSRIIDDLLDVSRISQGKIQLRKQLTDITLMVNHAVETVRPLIETRRHRLTIAVVPGTPRVEGDPTRLEQVLVNLLTNAAKYTESGGRIDLECRPDGDHVVVSVRDSGVGIAPEQLPRMFDLFVQADRSLERSEGGLGIGLTLVRRLVELHGGSVRAHSDGLGKGTEFTVRLPAAGPEAARGATVPSELRRERPSLAPRRILVVDDNEATARGLARLLKLASHTVDILHEGRAAAEAARRLAPDVVLLDIGLPGMDGYQVARAIRQEEACAATLLIAVSGYGQDEDKRRSREAGFDEHLVKPVDVDALLELIAQRVGTSPPSRRGTTG